MNLASKMLSREAVHKKKRLQTLKQKIKLYQEVCKNNYKDCKRLQN